MTTKNCVCRFIFSFGFKFFLLGVLLIAVAGCGNGLAKVKGNVTLGDEPLAAKDLVKAKVLFYPEVGTGTPAIGVLDEEGNYQLTTGSQVGIKPGKYLVSVAATETVPSKQAGGLPSGRRLTPSKYANPKTSGFTAMVESGSNEFDFNLVPEPKKSTRVSRRR